MFTRVYCNHLSIRFNCNVWETRFEGLYVTDYCHQSHKKWSAILVWNYKFDMYFWLCTELLDDEKFIDQELQYFSIEHFLL